MKSLAQLSACSSNATSSTTNAGDHDDGTASLWSKSVNTDVFFSQQLSNGGDSGKKDEGRDYHRLTDRASLTRALKEPLATNLADGEADHWPQYIIGVIHALYETLVTSTPDPSSFLEHQLKRGATVVVVSDIPKNAGLASSAALELSAVKATQAVQVAVQRSYCAVVAAP